jgi:hypothetical protein
MPSIKLDESAVLLPADTTANRPTAATGLLRYNTSKGNHEFYDSLNAWRPTGGVLHTHHFEDATRNIFNNGGTDIVTATVWSFDFTKRYADSFIIIRGHIPVSGQYSYQSGEYIEIAGTRKYEACHYLSPFASEGDDGRYGGCWVNAMWTNILTTGSKTVTYGWFSNDGAGQRPGIYTNPDQRGPRSRNRTTIIDIFEIDPASLANIT